MATVGQEEEALGGLMLDEALGAELMRAYVRWLQESLERIRSWIRTDNRARLATEAHAIAIATAGLWSDRVSGLAARLQAAAKDGSTAQLARICGGFHSQIDQMSDAADVIDGCRLARVRAR